MNNEEVIRRLEVIADWWCNGYVNRSVEDVFALRHAVKAIREREELQAEVAEWKRAMQRDQCRAATLREAAAIVAKAHPLPTHQDNANYARQSLVNLLLDAAQEAEDQAQ